jgi:hypothetical protein
MLPPHHDQAPRSGAHDERSSAGGARDPMTWAWLLARWTEFAQASVAFPNTGEGARWKAIVPDVIGLQAITHALAEAVDLPPGEHALALERAELGIAQHVARINHAWRGEPMPESLIELVGDARAALGLARSLVVEFVVAGRSLVMPDIQPALDALREAGWAGTARIALPGTVLFEREPAATLWPCVGVPDAAVCALEAIDGLVRTPQPVPAQQVYRQIDEMSGQITGDLVLAMSASLPPGRPLLVTVVDQGAPTDALRAHDAATWYEQQRHAGLDRHAPLPVRFGMD